MATELVTKALALDKNDLKAMFEALNIKEGIEKEPILIHASDAAWKNCNAIREAVRYPRFDAKQIIAQFFKKSEENPISKGDKPTISCGGAMLYEKNDAKTDLWFFLNVFLERGNNISKAILRCDARTGSVLRRKASAYGMGTGKNKSILRPHDLTLARLAQAFSVCAATIIVRKKMPGKLVSKLFGPLRILLLQHTVLPGLIPASANYTEDLRLVAVILNMEMSILLADQKKQLKMAVKTINELIESSGQFVDAMKDNMVSDALKIKILVEAGVATMSSGTIVLSDEMKPLVLMANLISSRGSQSYQAVVEAMAQHRADAEKRDVTAEGKTAPNI